MRRAYAIHTERLIRRLVALPRARKRALMVITDIVFIPAALWVAVALKIGRLPEGFAATPLPYVLTVLVSVPMFARLGLYRAVVRFIEPKVIFVVLAGVTASTATLLVADLVLANRGIPVTAVAIYWAIALVYVGGSRMMGRYLLTPRHKAGDRVAIYGAGMAGVEVASALKGRGRLTPIAFVDDEATLHGSFIQGIEVYPPSELERLIAEEAVKTVLLAMPSQSRRRRSEILGALELLQVRVMTMPEIADLATGAARVEDIRDVEVSDLLGRDVVPPDEQLLDACIRGKAVLVTGAGGSIGSELCRQIIRRKPRSLVLLEISEPALYAIERDLLRQMAREGLATELFALLGSPHHRYRSCEIMRAYGIHTVYHAAAYKHVPIVEQNLVEGIHNNVYTTWYAAVEALETGVETFVLISTDKAVNPTNIMGASKRFAEIVLQSLQTQTTRTRFCMVRFGNVLGSSGSVVPLFQEQIRSGGPVTVTHRDVRRYFMTIPEAAQLVLQAGSMGTGGDVFVLDMGDPVQIDDLARRMIKLSGMSVRDADHPDGDIEIEYSGLRPGEKLYEELLIGSNVTGTGHPMIMRAMEPTPTWEEVKALLAELGLAMDRMDCPHVISVLEKAVPQYRRSILIHDLVFEQQPAEARTMEPGDPKVVVLAEHRGQKLPS